MRKETLIAIFLGITLGIFVALFIMLKTKEKSLETAKPISKEAKITPKISPTTFPVETLEISQPKEGSVVNQKNITIEGRAIKDGLIVIQSPIKNLTFQNSKQEFKVDIPLAFGENIIQITVYPKNSQIRPQEQELRIFYLDEL